MRRQSREGYDNDHRYGHCDIDGALTSLRKVQAFESYPGPEPQKMYSRPDNIEDDELNGDFEAGLLGQESERCKERGVYGVGFGVHSLEQDSAFDAGRRCAFNKGKL